MALSRSLPPTAKSRNPDRQALLRPPQAAEFLGLSASTLARYRCHKVGPAYLVIAGNRIRYSPEDLQAYATAKKVFHDN